VCVCAQDDSANGASSKLLLLVLLLSQGLPSRALLAGPAPTLRRSRCVMSLASGAGPSIASITLLRGLVSCRIASRRRCSSVWYLSYVGAVVVVARRGGGGQGRGTAAAAAF
jgi:hypothetical protein